MRGYYRLSEAAEAEFAEEIRVAQLSAAFRLLPIAVAVNAINGVITATVLHRLADGQRPLVWLCIILLVTSGRGALWLQHRRAGYGAAEIPRWSWLVPCSSLLAGLCWGLGGALLLPSTPVLGQIFLIFVVGGMCAGSVVTSAPHLPSLLAFLFSASLPMAAGLLFEGNTTATALGLMILVFVGALSVAGLHLNRFFAQTMRLRFELSAANRRLRAETAEREATEAALRQAQKLEAIGQLTGGISHDFNNLLTVVIGNLTMAVARADDAPAALRLVQSALQAAERGATLVQRLLAFARTQRLEPRSVDLKSLIRGIEDMLRRTLGDRVRLQIDAGADLAPALVDANQLELAMLNLTINARDAMPNGGILRISLQNRRTGPDSPPELASGTYVVLSVGDTGNGMDEATLARAFEPFFTTKEIGSGSGLGLPMVQRFAAQSGGGVRMRSTLGEGTTVQLWLPRAV